MNDLSNSIGGNRVRMRDDLERLIEQGYRDCQLLVKKRFGKLRWIISNLPSDHQRQLAPILSHLIRILDLFSLESADGRPLDIWNETRFELNEALLGTSQDAELMALADIASRYQIPHQFLFDPYFGCDVWIRQHQFPTFTELDSFLAQVGGSFMISATPVLGVTKLGFEEVAMDCGKAVLLTALLANFVADARLNHVFLAVEDLKTCDIDIQRIKVRKTCPTLKHLVRLYCWRIEKLLEKGGGLLNFLDFDGRRSMTSLLSLVCKIKSKLQMQPDSILSEEGVLTPRELFKLRARHLLGLEEEIPFVGEDPQHH